VIPKRSKTGRELQRLSAYTPPYGWQVLLMSRAKEILELIRRHAPPSVSPYAHASYTGAAHRSYGLSTPVMRQLVREWVKENRANLTFDEWVVTLDDLYRGESLEEKMVTGKLLGAFPAFRRKLPLPRLDAWLNELQGWAEVDGTCQSVFTAEDLLANWNEWQAFLRKLAADANINKRRACLVLLTKPIRDSDDPKLISLALELVEALKHERDKLITKAISWLLRAGIKHHRTEIERYVESKHETLPRVAVREVNNKLTTGRK
jgi:3-methyladenine DNA glycosylase AlkD